MGTTWEEGCKANVHGLAHKRCMGCIKHKTLATQDLLIRVAMHMHATAVTRQAHELLNTRLWSVPHKVLDDI